MAWVLDFFCPQRSVVQPHRPNDLAQSLGWQGAVARRPSALRVQSSVMRVTEQRSSAVIQSCSRCA